MHNQNKVIHNQKQHQNELNSDYGAYATFLSFGTPPQPQPLILDTAFSHVSSPCTPDHMCSYCDNIIFNSHSQKTLLFSFPTNFASAKTLNCASQQCAYLVTPNIQERCSNCKNGFTSCNEPCPPYGSRIYSNDGGFSEEYGLYITDTLNFLGEKMDGFVIGCSNMSFVGVAGFGRGPLSLPGQMGIKKFSYCLVSDFKSSELILYTNSTNVSSDGDDLKYTQFLYIDSPQSLWGPKRSRAPLRRLHALARQFFKRLNHGDLKFRYQESGPQSRNLDSYYYLSLGKIYVGEVDIGVPAEYLVPDLTGNGGLVVVTSTSLSFLKKDLYNVVVQEFESQTNEYSRARNIEDQWGLKPCYLVNAKSPDKFPRMKLSFREDEEMEVAMMGYFHYSDDQDLACMTFYTDDSESSQGPSIILGNYQQQNIFMEFDLANDRLGFREKIC